MTDKPQQLQYKEIREHSVLEAILRDRRWNLVTAIALSITILSIALALYHLFAAAFGAPQARAFRGTHLAVMFVIAILLNPLFRATWHDPLLQPGGSGNGKRMIGFAVDMALIALSLFIQSYTLYDIDEFQGRVGDLSDWDIGVGAMMIVLVLEATRRAVGWTMVALGLFFIAHSLYANYFFGILYGPPTAFDRYIDVLFLQTEGIYGVPIFVVSTYILLFILFGAILLRSGAGRFFIDFAVALTGHRTGGPAKAAVVASAFMGTISGSAVANVVTTGSFTIPMMKNLGYRAKFAAAVEACASSGGQITPPIMGAAAFIMAEFLQVSYLWVIVAAIIPAALYFATVYFMVHLEAEKYGIERIEKDRLPQILEVLGRGWHLLLSLIVLIVFLAIGFTPMMAAFWAIITLTLLTFVNKSTRMSAVDLFAALEAGVRSTVPVTIACACAGIIIGSIFVSGFGLKFTHSVISLAGGSLMILLILTAIAGIILGMGMTTTAVYITVAALIVPALVDIGVTKVAAHMFAFYYGVVSSITPPVALAAFGAAAIAGSPPMATALESARVGVAKYLVPFIFVYNPSLLFEGPVWLTVYSAIAALVGVWALSLALEGWYKGPLKMPLRLAIGTAAIAVMFPPLLHPIGISAFVFNGAGAIVLVLIYISKRQAGRRRKLAAGKAAP